MFIGLLGEPPLDPHRWLVKVPLMRTSWDGQSSEPAPTEVAGPPVQRAKGPGPRGLGFACCEKWEAHWELVGIYPTGIGDLMEIYLQM